LGLDFRQESPLKQSGFNTEQHIKNVKPVLEAQLIRLNINAGVLLMSQVVKMRKLTFEAHLFREEATYWKSKTNLLSAYDGSMVQFGPRVSEN